MLRLLKKLIHLFKKKNEKISKSKMLQINEDIILTVMDKLSHFENTHGFLKQVTLHSLAKELDTNPKYLSKIINTHYEKNFSRYINDLRIHYLLKELQKNDELHTVTIKFLAKKAGFGNTESFTKSFKKYTGTTPSYYLQKLQDT